MPGTNRRAAIQGAVASVALVTTAGIGATAGADAEEPKLWTLEGELKVHPKFLYRYYLVFDGQKCALYGKDHARNPPELAAIEAPARVRVQGTFGSDYHAGGTKENLSPFPPCWTLFMDVHKVDVLR